MSCGGTCIPSQPQMLRPELAVSLELPSPFSWFGWLVYQQRRWRMGTELRELSDRQLRDVGLTRAEVDAALARPFWQS